MAAGAALSGKDMDIKYGASPASALHAGSWSITKKVEVGKYASNSTSGWKKAVAGVKDWSGSMRVIIHDGGALEWSIEGAEVQCQFHVGASDYYSGKIRITEVSEEVDAESGDPIASNITFEGSGALTSSGTSLDV